MQKKIGLSDDDKIRLSDKVIEIIGTGSLASSDVCKAITDHRSYSSPHIRLVIKFLWEAGVLKYVNKSPSWWKEDRTYAVQDRNCGPHSTAAITEEEAERLLIQDYFVRYGPASIADAAWWSGLSRKRITRALARLDERLVEVTIDGIEDVCLVAEGDLDIPPLSSQLARENVRLLAYEDNFLKGFMQSRKRFVPIEYYDAVFNAIGEARATIVADGQVIGIWGYDVLKNVINTSLFFPVADVIKKQLTIEVDNLLCVIQANSMRDLFST